MAGLETDADLDRRIKELEDGLLQDREAEGKRREDATVAQEEWSMVRSRIRAREAALAELKKAWAERGLPERATESAS